MNLPIILPPPDGVTSEQMERDGWLRLVEQKHRARLLYSHSYGQHRSPVEGCQDCAAVVGLLCAGWYEPKKSVEELFR